MKLIPLYPEALRVNPVILDAKPDDPFGLAVQRAVGVVGHSVGYDYAVLH